MRLSLGFKIAFRYFFSKKTHNAVNYIATVALCTTALATAAIIIVLSVFNGFVELAESKFSKLEPPVKIISREKSFFNADSIYGKLLNVQGVQDLSPVLESKIYLQSDFSQGIAKMIGVEEDFVDLAGIHNSLIDGVAYVGDTLNCQWGIIGSGLAVRLNVRPGVNGMLTLMIPKVEGRINPGSLLSSFRTDSIMVAGVVQIGDQKTDDNLIYIPLSAARSLTGAEKGEVSAIYLYPGQGFNLEKLKSDLDKDKYMVLDIYGQNEESFKMINVEKWITFVLLAFILLVASFNIVSSLTMLIIEKRSNMGVLRAMGCSGSTIKSIFIFEGALMTLMGGIAGCILGSLLVIGQKYFGWIKLTSPIDTAALSIDVYPVELLSGDFFVVLGLVIALALLATTVVMTTFTKEDERLIQ